MFLAAVSYIDNLRLNIFSQTLVRVFRIGIETSWGFSDTRRKLSIICHILVYKVTNLKLWGQLIVVEKKNEIKRGKAPKNW